jgi:hypothetical protein
MENTFQVEIRTIMYPFGQNDRMRRAALVAFWIGTVSFTGMLFGLAYELGRPRPPAQAMDIERLPKRQNRNPWARWSVTEQLSAHRVLIVQVETDYLHEAFAISQHLANPIKERYAEVLIYFHRPGRPDTLPPRRVQWTAKTGYVETVYE